MLHGAGIFSNIFPQKSPNFLGKISHTWSIWDVYLWDIISDINDVLEIIWLVVWNMFCFSIYWECHHPI